MLPVPLDNGCLSRVTAEHVKDEEERVRGAVG